MPPITEDAKNAPINWPTMVSGGDGSVATATVKCPRCDSPNTKFCYYNNYSLSQPRHFCKTCRRYWTKGGALRNIPVGGGCRKNKKSRSSFSTLSSAAKLFSPSSSSSSSSSSHHHQHQLLLPPPDRNTFFKSQVLGFGTIASPSQGFATPFLSFGDLSSTTEAEAQQPVVESGKNHNLLLTSSMESLFSTNHLLHWKLQQQQQQQQKQKQMLASPLEFLLQNNNSTSASPSEAQLPVLPSSFHLLQQPSFPFHVAPTEGSSVEQVCGSRINGDSTSDWFLGSSYTEEGFNPNVNSSSRADWTAAIPTWNLDMDRFTAL